MIKTSTQIRPLGYERVFLPLCKVADTPFHIQEHDILCYGKHQQLLLFASALQYYTQLCDGEACKPHLGYGCILVRDIYC